MALKIYQDAGLNLPPLRYQGREQSYVLGVLPATRLPKGLGFQKRPKARDSKNDSKKGKVGISTRIPEREGREDSQKAKR